MKKIFAGLLAVAFGIVLLIGISLNTGLFGYNDSLPEDGAASHYISKDVNGKTDEVVFGETTGAETGSANMVTSVIANYRSFDTLGEVTVLFLAALGVSLLAGTMDKGRKRSGSGFILRTSARILFPLMLVTGIYIFTHGHLTPGGGFPGGSMIASSFLLLYLADESFRANVKGFKVAEGLAGTLYVAIGIVGLLAAGYFLVNFLPTGTVGNLLSAGIIPVVYVIIGLKVGSEITGIVADMFNEEVKA
ncbi:MAG TPA: Na(+)/H(+) antiporter subunit B [Clostridia bacterium]|mgnify:CR=1 FL=1|nr:Na(+)/H(+) antiporter subunit B [Clostridia bacterium]HPQ46215.1 Na(+)/H(+) antiporter subunit B [Clostridia bacterium]HRX42333.1 Na(+)/H(+) antiporter subunit B [Clostridia bacterium]